MGKSFMDKKQKIDIVKLLLNALILLLIGAFCLKFMGNKEFLAVLQFWFSILIIGVTFLPVGLILFNRFHDNGWIFSKTIGIAVSAWLLWYLSSVKFLKFTRFNSILVIAICAVLNIVIFKLHARFSTNGVNIKECFSYEKIVSMFNAETIFLSVLMVWCYIKGFNPAAYSTEKFMDYGYITSILKSDYMPAHDMWLSGNNINYYYVGQYISAFLVRVSGVGAGYGYNLMMMTLAAFGFSLPYSIGYNLMNRAMSVKSAKVSSITGTLAGVSLSLAGNMHFPIFKWIMPKVQRILGQKVDSYWFADATRYIGYNPKRPDKTIHEFPSYSFVLGDLHAHVINIIFVLTVVGILFAWLIKRKPYTEIYKKNGLPDKINYIKEIFNPHMVMCMFFIGLFHMTNYWDFPIYFCVCGSIVLYSNLVTYRYTKHAWIMTALQGVTYVIVWTLVSLPFTLSFDSISSAIKFCTANHHTLWYQYLVLWGLPIMICGVFIVTRHIRAKKLNIKESIENQEEKKKFIPALLDSLTESDAFVFIISYCALGLIIIPEVIYVVDIYGGDFQRANTMFKLVYQAYMLFAISMPYILIKFLKFKVSPRLKTFAKVGLVLLCCTFVYFFEALDAWFGHYYTTIDASAFLKDEDEADAMAVEWINKNVSDDAVVLEMCGLSYSYFNRISVFTGNSTVLGWQTHEWLWRSSGAKGYPPEVSKRHEDVVKIYSSYNASEVVDLIRKYNIDYIYVGKAECYDGYASSSEANSDYGYFHGGNYKKISTNIELLRMLGNVTEFVPEGSVEGSFIVEIDDSKLEEIRNKTIVNPNKDKDSQRVSINYNDGHKDIVETTYNDDGNVATEVYLDENGTSYMTVNYSYDGFKPRIAEVYDNNNTLVGFYNFDKFDAFGRYTALIYFTADESWAYTTTKFYENDLVVKEETLHANGETDSVEYEFDSHEIMTGKTVSTKNGEEKFVYTNDGEKVIGGKKYVSGKEVATIEYSYSNN